MSIPSSVGRYRIDHVLGSGAFASVWLGHDDALAAQVAIKVLSGSLLDDLDVRNRFLEEARILRRADSERLVRVHDIGELPDGRPYFVMSYADRGTLADRMRERPLSVAEALAFAEEIAYGVEVINRLGVIHRDLKPSNVLFQSTRDAGERLLIADLGLAKALAHASGAFTLPVGTPGYMSPEQARFGGGLDVRADVYGLGALTYHMLTGRPPGPAPVKAPPSSLREGLPSEFDQVILRAMEVERERRWPTAEAFGRALTTLRPTMPPSEEPEQYGAARQQPQEQYAAHAGQPGYGGQGGWYGPPAGEPGGEQYGAAGQQVTPPDFQTPQRTPPPEGRPGGYVQNPEAIPTVADHLDRIPEPGPAAGDDATVGMPTGQAPGGQGGYPAGGPAPANQGGYGPGDPAAHQQPDYGQGPPPQPPGDQARYGPGGPGPGDQGGHGPGPAGPGGPGPGDQGGYGPGGPGPGDQGGYGPGGPGPGDQGGYGPGPAGPGGPGPGDQGGYGPGGPGPGDQGGYGPGGPGPGDQGGYGPGPGGPGGPRPGDQGGYGPGGPGGGDRGGQGGQFPPEGATAVFQVPQGGQPPGGPYPAGTPRDGMQMPADQGGRHRGGAESRFKKLMIPLAIAAGLLVIALAAGLLIGNIFSGDDKKKETKGPGIPKDFVTISDASGKLTAAVPKVWPKVERPTWLPSSVGLADQRARPVLRATPNFDQFLQSTAKTPGVFIGLTTDVGAGKLPPAQAAKHANCTAGRPEKFTTPDGALSGTVTRFTKCQGGTPTITEVGLVDKAGKFGLWIRVKEVDNRGAATDILKNLKVKGP